MPSPVLPSPETARLRVSQGKSNLEDSIALLPTPTASDRFGPGTHGDGGADLRTAVTLLPTPTARDWKAIRREHTDHTGTPSLASLGTAVSHRPALQLL